MPQVGSASINGHLAQHQSIVPSDRAECSIVVRIAQARLELIRSREERFQACKKATPPMLIVLARVLYLHIADRVHDNLNGAPGLDRSRGISLVAAADKVGYQRVSLRSVLH